MDCLFCKIVEGKIPAKTLYEDDQVIAFHDINPQAPVHFLVLPKKHIATLNDMTEDDRALVGHIIYVGQKLALELGCEQGFRTVFNCKEFGSQSVYHIHLHVLGQRQMGWPPG
ncbi:histidine triad nucleotide-binding protein [Pseudomonas saliphila]|uniref:histidine triad nucleotide-binding protein n=1 Tax=Pseudomonas saliphila TaxID=2586906 RepID=UPI00123A3C3C|nr:histidine triad nucleotide-binding protein [Pseudomonas saliphila]